MAVTVIEAGTIEVAGEAMPLRVRIDPRARRLILRLSTDHVRVTCPSRRHVGSAVRLAQERRGWIEGQAAKRPPPASLAPGASFSLFGEEVTVVRAASPGAAARLSASIVATGGEGAAAERRVERLLRRIAREGLAGMADAHAAALGFPPCPVAVRQMRSRWGSCSARPSIAFDWRLCLAPLEVADYVAAHETAHRVQMNHSPAFWAVVERLCPGWRPLDRWLDDHGAALHAYGRLARS
jgi:predicted metal-dependent hydrolase